MRFRRNREEHEIEEEIRSHIAIETRRRIEAGEDPAAALQAARRMFGNLPKTREETREAWGWLPIGTLAGDLRYGLRLLARTPLWTAIVCLTLSLGIGLSTAIFSVVYGVLLQPLPYPRADRIMALWPSWSKQEHARFRVSAALWLHWREQSQLFEDIALTRPVANFNLTGDGPPERLQGARISFNLLRVLRVTPLLGRGFTEAEQQSDAKVALLSFGLWQRRFGSDPEVLGRKIPLNGEPYEIIGILPRDFRYPTRDFELWTPLYLPPREIREGVNYQYLAVGRLKDGVTQAAAQSEISGIMRRLARRYPDIYRARKEERNENLDALVEPLAVSEVSQVRSTLYVLLAAAGSLLLIGCLNLGVLLIARASARSREMAVRAALGASRARLSRQMLAEVLPLGAAGAIGGVVLSCALLKVLLPLIPATMPHIAAIGLQAPVLLFAVIASLAVVLLAGLLPAYVVTQDERNGALQRHSRSVVSGGKVQNMLVVAQIAVAVVLLFSGSLFVRSFQALLRVNPGFSTQGELTLHLAVTRARYPGDRDVSDYYERLIARILSIPGVTEAGAVNRLPLSGMPQTGPIEFEGNPEKFDADWRSATPGYFAAIGIPLERGRVFTEQDRANSPAVGLIDSQMARKVFGSENPLGKRFRINLAGEQGPWTEIVGVVGHILNDTPEKDYRPQVYWPETQRTQDRAALVVRTAGPPASFTSAAIAQIHKENPAQPVYEVRPMSGWMERSLQSRSLLTRLVGLFGGASLLLACLGLYGVMSYTVGLRLREFGIRMALGARSSHVRSLALAQAAKLALWGSAFGLALAWPAGRVIRGLLFHVTNLDAVSWILAPALLAAAALLAALGPALRASRTDPAATLRAE